MSLQYGQLHRVRVCALGNSAGATVGSRAESTYVCFMGNSTKLVSTLWAKAQSLILRCSQQGTVWRYVVSISTGNCGQLHKVWYCWGSQFRAWLWAAYDRRKIVFIQCGKEHSWGLSAVGNRTNWSLRDGKQLYSMWQCRLTAWPRRRIDRNFNFYSSFRATLAIKNVHVIILLLGPKYNITHYKIREI